LAIPRILHYPGSKWSMADWIISHFPEHQTYLEPFFGSGAVLFSKKRSELETINDIDGEVINLFKVIREKPDELAYSIYADPPYILSTRTTSSYKNEMTNEDHVELLEVLDKHPGPVILSGYSHPIYDEILKHWRRETKRAKAEAGAIREEVLWINPIAVEYGFQQQSLF
jgi:site-specific DNA-adenine methylase